LLEERLTTTAPGAAGHSSTSEPATLCPPTTGLRLSVNDDTPLGRTFSGVEPPLTRVRTAFTTVDLPLRAAITAVDLPLTGVNLAITGVKLPLTRVRAAITATLHRK
jgi:hypothetical protein